MTLGTKVIEGTRNLRKTLQINKLGIIYKSESHILAENNLI